MKIPRWYRRKPTSYQAMQWDGTNESYWSLVGFTEGNLRWKDNVSGSIVELYTQNSVWQPLKQSDWVIKIEERFIWVDGEEFKKDWGKGSPPPVTRRGRPFATRPDVFEDDDEDDED